MKQEFEIRDGQTLPMLESMGVVFFNQDQKAAIRARDGGRCQFPAPHECDGQAQLEVHHIIPRRYSNEIGIDPEYPENGITLCSHSHQRMVHPDMKEAAHQYFKDHDSFKKAFQSRDEKLKHHEIYWNDHWDRLFHVIAIRNTQRARRNEWEFPE